MSGNVVVRPLTAKLTRSTEFFGKMDPLVKVIIGTHTQRTAVAKKGHKNPGWETELSLRRGLEDIIHFEVWDKDILKGDLIGMGDISFNQLFVLGNKFNGWIPLKYKGKDAGELLVDIIFIPDAGVNTTEMLTQSMQQSQPVLQSNLIPIAVTQSVQQTSSQQLQQSVPLTQSILKSRPPANETPRNSTLPEPTYLQSTQPQNTQEFVVYSTPLSSFEKVEKISHPTQYGHPHCSGFHESTTGEIKKESREKESTNIEIFQIPKMETQGLSERKPIFQTSMRGDLGNPNLEKSGENIGFKNA